MICYKCKDKNIKCEKIEYVDYYEEEKKEKDSDIGEKFSDWRD